MPKFKKLSHSMAGPKEINQPIKPIDALRTERDKLSGMITRREQTIANAGVTGAIRIGQPWEHGGRGGDGLSATLKVGRARRAARRSVERMSGDLKQLDAEITGYDRARDYETHVQQLQTRLGEAAELVAEGVLAQEDIAEPNKEYETLLTLPSKDPYLARGLERLRREREVPDADRTITDRRTEDKPAYEKREAREERGPAHVHPTRAAALTLFLGEDAVQTDEIITALGPTRGERPKPLNRAQAADALRNALSTIARRVADGTATPEERELYKLRESYMERQGITTVGDLTHHIRTRLGVNTAGYQKRRKQDGTPSPNPEKAPGVQGVETGDIITEVVAELIEVRRGTVAQPDGEHVLVTTATAVEQAGGEDASQSEVARKEPQEKPKLILPEGRELTDEQLTLLYVLYQGYGKDQLSALALGQEVQQIVWQDEELLDDTLRHRIFRLIRGTEEQEGLNKILEGTGWEIKIKSGATGGPYLEYKEPTPEIAAPPVEVIPQVAAVTRAPEAVVDTPQPTDRDASEREKPALELPGLTDNERLLVEKLYEAYGVQNLSMTTLAKTLWEETLPVGTASTRIHRLLAGLHSKLEGTGWEITSLRGRNGGLTLRYEPPLTTDAVLGATGVEVIIPTQDRRFDLKAAMEEAIRGPHDEIAEATGAALARAVEGVTAQGKEGRLLSLLLGSSIFDVRERDSLASSLWPEEKRVERKRDRLGSMVSELRLKLKQQGVTIGLRHELVLGRATREDRLDVPYGYFLAPDKEVEHLPVRTMEDVIAEVEPVGEYGTLNKANIAMIAGALDRFQGKINPLLSVLGLPELPLDLIDQLETINDDASIPGRDKVQAGDLSTFISAYRAHSLQKAIDLINADDFADQWNVINEHHAGVGELLTVLANLRAVKGRVNGNSEINGLEYLHELMQDPELSVEEYHVTHIATEVPLGDVTLPSGGDIVMLSQSPVATGVESYDKTLDITKEVATPLTEAKARSTFAKLLTRDPEAITTMEEYFAAIVAEAPNVLQGRRLAEVTVREMFPQLADFPFGKNGIKRAIGRKLRPGKQGIYDLSAEGIAAALYLHESTQLPRDVMRQILPLAEYVYRNYLDARESESASLPPSGNIVDFGDVGEGNGDKRDPFHRILDKDPMARERFEDYFNDLEERRTDVHTGELMNIDTVKALFPRLGRFPFLDRARDNTVPSYVNPTSGGCAFDAVGVATMLYLADTGGNLRASVKKQVKRLAEAEYEKWVATKAEQESKGSK